MRLRKLDKEYDLGTESQYISLNAEERKVIKASNGRKRF